MDEREKLVQELDYYLNKVSTLRSSLQKTISQGKKENSKDEERRIRNEETLKGVQTEYDKLNTELIYELTLYWEKRMDLLAPIVREYMSVQRLIGTVHVDLISHIESYAARNHVPEL